MQDSRCVPRPWDLLSRVAVFFLSPSVLGRGLKLPNRENLRKKKSSPTVGVAVVGLNNSIDESTHGRGAASVPEELNISPDST